MSEVEVTCPHCNKEMTVQLDDPNEGKTFEDYQCHHCELWFEFTLGIYVEFDAYNIKKSVEEDEPCSTCPHLRTTKTPYGTHMTATHLCILSGESISNYTINTGSTDALCKLKHDKEVSE